MALVPRAVSLDIRSLRGASMAAGLITRRMRTAVLLTGALLLPLGLVGAQNPNEKEIKPAPNIQDKDEIYDKDGKPKLGSKLWVLDFKIKPLRSIKVNVPGRGEQICYYLWYQVTNRTSEPHTFVPD